MFTPFLRFFVIVSMSYFREYLVQFWLFSTFFQIWSIKFYDYFCLFFSSSDFCPIVDGFSSVSSVFVFFSSFFPVFRDSLAKFWLFPPKKTSFGRSIFPFISAFFSFSFFLQFLTFFPWLCPFFLVFFSFPRCLLRSISYAWLFVWTRKEKRGNKKNPRPLSCSNFLPD